MLWPCFAAVRQAALCKLIHFPNQWHWHAPALPAANYSVYASLFVPRMCWALKFNIFTQLNGYILSVIDHYHVMLQCGVSYAADSFIFSVCLPAMSGENALSSTLPLPINARPFIMNGKVWWQGSQCHRNYTRAQYVFFSLPLVYIQV